MEQKCKLEIIAESNRKRLMEVIYNAGAGHTGGDLSCLNVLTVLYHRVLNLNVSNFENSDRDRFILSKGHCAEALYTVLESKEILSKNVVDTLGKYNSPLAGHPLKNIPGIEVSSGALGHGLSIAVGMAMAAKMDGKTYRTFVLMGDGEQDEGSIYEAAMAASHYKLNNLVAIIDRNNLQLSGKTEDLMSLEDMEARWTDFGWDVAHMNGDDVADICRAFDLIDYECNMPHLLISHTTKGYGVSFMEGVASWHHGVPSVEQYAQAMKEIEERIKSAKEEC